MKNRGINSYNEIYNFKLLRTYISVSRIKDEDLIYLKSNYPLDMIRLAEAGYEANLELSLEINKELSLEINKNDFIYRKTCWMNYFTVF